MTPDEKFGQHFVEDTVSVYLVFDSSAERWRVDTATVDGAALDSPKLNGPSTSECECGSPAECAAVRERAATVAQPTGHELIALLQEATRQTGPR